MAKKAGKHNGSDVYVADIEGCVRGVDQERRELTIMGTTEARDRHGDVVALKGWQLDNYRKNPVFLWAHDYTSVPIGVTSKLKRVKEPGPGLLFTIRFPSEGTYPFADTIFNLYREGIINASSVGFIPTKWEDLTFKDEETGEESHGFRFVRQELLELSGVAVPSNPEALQMGLRKFCSSDEQAGAMADSIMGSKTLYPPSVELVRGQLRNIFAEGLVLEGFGTGTGKMFFLGSPDPDQEKKDQVETPSQDHQDSQEQAPENRTVVPYKKFPIIDEAWDGATASSRLAAWAGGPDKDAIDWAKYRSGFGWYDADDAENYGAYKFPHHDVKDGSMVTAIRGVMAAMAVVNGGRGGADIPEEDRQTLYNHLAKHYADADKEPPDMKTISPQEEDDESMRAAADGIVDVFLESLSNMAAESLARIEFKVDSLLSLIRIALADDEAGEEGDDDEEEDLEKILNKMKKLVGN